MKNIYKKHCFMFIIMVFFIFSHKVSANLEITEIMYNSKGADIDWIEVYNPDGSGVDLSKIKLLVSNSESNHGIVGYDGSQYLKSGDYGVIVVGSQISQFLSKWSNVKNLFTSSFSLPNLKDGESSSVEINYGDKISPIDSISYDSSKGASDNGNSLQLIGGIWTESLPTPGDVNINNQNNNDETDYSLDTNNNSISTSKSSEISISSKEVLKIYKIETKIISPKTVIAGVPFMIDHQTSGEKREDVIIGRFVWNFGDGVKKEVATSEPFPYIYQYPGDYVLTLSFYDSHFDIVPDSTDRIIVKVVPSGIVISSVGTQNDPYVEIENNSNYEMSLHDWIIKGVRHSFVIPEGLTILPNKKIKLSPRVTGFDLNDLSNISIMDSSGQVFANYPKITLPSHKYSQSRDISTGIVKADVAKDDILNNNSNVINLNDLSANSLGGDNSEFINKSFYVWSALIAVIIIGIYSILLIRRKDGYQDYIEKELSAKDMTIIE